MALGKIPRGIIVHSLQESLVGFFQSIFFKLNDNAQIEGFENAFANHCNAKHCVSFGFARTSILFILKSLNLPPGSEILMPPITIKGILDAVISLGLKPVYIDLDADTFCINLKKLNDEDNQNIKAAIITPLYGLIPNLEEISYALRSKKIFSILDFSHSLNATYKQKKITSFFDASVYSSSSIKILDTLGGGHVLTNDNKLFAVLKTKQESLRKPDRSALIKKAFINLYRNLATSHPIFGLITYPLIQLMSFFSRGLVLKQTGRRDKKPITEMPSVWFSQFSSVQAKIGLNLIARTKEMDFIRINNAKQIRSKIGDYHFPRTTLESKNVFWQLIVLVNDSRIFQKFCLSRGIDVATSSLELLPSLKGYPGRVDLEIASNLYKNACIIPCNHLLKKKEIDKISRIIKIYFDELNLT